MSSLTRYYQLIHNGMERTDALIRARGEGRGTASAPPVALISVEYTCQECGREIRGYSAAVRARDEGCPRCEGTDIELVRPCNVPEVRVA